MVHVGSLVRIYQLYAQSISRHIGNPTHHTPQVIGSLSSLTQFHKLTHFKSEVGFYFCLRYVTAQAAQFALRSLEAFEVLHLQPDKLRWQVSSSSHCL